MVYTLMLLIIFQINIGGIDETLESATKILEERLPSVEKLYEKVRECKTLM